MSFRKFKQNKLWRDKAVGRMERVGSVVHWSRLDDQEFAKQLKMKFLEEAHEVYNATTKPALIEELADVLEVVTALCKAHQFTFQDILAAKHKKYEERGGFEERRFVTMAECEDGSFGAEYFLADPEKYPEVID